MVENSTPHVLDKLGLGWEVIHAANPAAVLQMFKSPGFWLSYLVVLILIVGINNALIARLDGIAAARMETLGISMRRGFRLVGRTILLYLAMFAVMLIAGIFVGIGAGILGTFRFAQGIFLAAAVALGIYAGGRVFLANTAQGYAETCRMLGACNMTAALPRLNMPVRIAVGDEDYATPVAMSQTLHRGIAGSTLNVISNARHLTPLECPQQIAAELEKLIEAVPAQ